MEKADRIKEAFQFLKGKGMVHTQKDLAAKIGASEQNVSSALKGNPRVLTDKFIKRLNRAFNEPFNLNWLLNGEGEMLSTPEESTSAPSVPDNLIPFYDAETTGGYEGLVSSSNDEVSLKGYIQAGGWFNGKETAAIRHVGESMVEYPNGCVLVVKEITNRNMLVPGQPYVIETSEYRITKRVQRGSSPNTIALYSTNQEKYEDGRLVYEPFEVSLEDVRRIFSVLGYIVNQSGDFRLIKP